MGIIFAIAIFIGFGILISRLSAFVGTKIFRFSDIFKYLIKLFKKQTI
nr:hypothetical protein [uncultured Aminipila sp.]